MLQIGQNMLQEINISNVENMLLESKCYHCGKYVTRGLGLNVTNVENMLQED